MVEQSSLNDIFGALADPTRRAILKSLTEGAATVSELAEPHDLTLAGVSKHLGVLSRAGLVRKRRRGREVLCSLEPAGLRAASHWTDRINHFWSSRLDRLEEVVLEEIAATTAKDTHTLTGGPDE